MRRLILMRHAKSSWDGGEPDLRRPLNGRGRRDAPRVADRLLELGWVPELVISSDSRRTAETWALMCLRFADPPRVLFRRGLYHGGLGALQDAVEDVPDDVTTLLALGHNPGWEMAAGLLARTPIRMTTGNAVLLELEGATWTDALTSPGRVVAVIRPKELRGAGATED